MPRPKDKYQPDEAPLSSNPFATLSGLKNSDAVQNPQAHEANPGTSESRDAPAAVRLPKVRSARIERARRGGKTVTVVSFHGDPSDDEKLLWLKNMKKKLGVGGSVEDGTVILQGDQRDQLGRTNQP